VNVVVLCPRIVDRVIVSWCTQSTDRHRSLVVEAVNARWIAGGPVDSHQPDPVVAELVGPINTSSIEPEACSCVWMAMPRADKSRFAVKKFTTTLWLALTSCRPDANGWALRPKSSSTSYGVAVHSAEVGVHRQGRRIVNDDLSCLRLLGILLRFNAGILHIGLFDFAHAGLPSKLLRHHSGELNSRPTLM
jgi:hypothetical protein